MAVHWWSPHSTASSRAPRFCRATGQPIEICLCRSRSLRLRTEYHSSLLLRLWKSLSGFRSWSADLSRSARTPGGSIAIAHETDRLHHRCEIWIESIVQWTGQDEIDWSTRSVLLRGSSGLFIVVRWTEWLFLSAGRCSSDESLLRYQNFRWLSSDKARPVEKNLAECRSALQSIHQRVEWNLGWSQWTIHRDEGKYRSWPLSQDILHLGSLP